MSLDNSGRMIESVLTTATLLRHIRDSDSTTITELSNKINKTPGTVHTHLATLKEAGLVAQIDNKYRLGPQFLPYGEAVRNNSDLFQASKNQVNNLAIDNKECAHLIIEHAGKLFSLYERFSPEAVGVEFHDRKREKPLDHLHCTAAGKSILAHLPKDRRDEIVQSSKLPEITPKTTTDPDQLTEELDQIRKKGFALADEEQMEGIRAVGAPIIKGNEEVAGSIALSGPTARFQGELFREELPEKVIQAANICEVNLQSIKLEDRYI